MLQFFTRYFFKVYQNVKTLTHIETLAQDLNTLQSYTKCHCHKINSECIYSECLKKILDPILAVKVEARQHEVCGCILQEKTTILHVIHRN